MTMVLENQNQPTSSSDLSEMNLALLLPDGRGLRNFILGPFLGEMQGRGEIQALHAVPEDHLEPFSSLADDSVHWYPLLPFHDTAASFVLRNCLSYAQMYWVDSFAMRFQRTRPIKTPSFARNTCLRTAKAVGRISSSPRGIKILERFHNAATSRMSIVQYYRDLFQKTKPNILFCSHQRPAEIIPPVLAARELGIPTSTFIFSWDNLTSKGRIAAPFDHFLVWSEHMKGDLLKFYPDVSEDRIHVVGTPQFDPYADESLVMSREEFCAQIGADPSRPLICYSCGDAGNAPQDPEHAETLMAHIRSGKIKGNPQVILRPAPSDDGSRYRHIAEKYPETFLCRPEWTFTMPNNWSAIVPTQNDVVMMVNLMRHCEININFASTMTLDFAIHDKPVINVAFDTSDPPPFEMSLWDYQNQFEHYQPVVELAAARFAKSADELAEHVNTYLEHPEYEREGRRKFVEMQVGQPIGESSRIIVDVLAKLAR